MRVARNTWLSPRDLGTGPESRDRWSTPWDIGHGTKAPGTADRLRALGHGPETPGKVGQTCGPSDPAPSPPGELVDPRDLRPVPESRRTAGQPRGSSDNGPSHAGLLVDTAGHQTRARFAREIWSIPRALRHGPFDTGPSGQDAWSNPRGRGYTHKLPGTAGPLRGHSHTGHRRPGCLLDTAVPPKRARVAQDNWSTKGPRTLTGVTWDSSSTPRALRSGPESPRTAGRHCGPLGTGPSRCGRLVHPTGYRT